MIAKQVNTMNLINTPNAAMCAQDPFLSAQGYAVTRELGRGMFGRVYEAVDASGTAYAIKRVDFARQAHPSPRGAQATATDELAIAQELAAHPAPHVVRVYKTHVDRACGAYYVVMELLRGNTLRDLIVRDARYRCGLRDERMLKNCIASIVEGVRELERRGIVHRDIKPENVFVCDRGTYTEVKLIDFGLGRFVSCGSEELMKSVVGTPLYMAPALDACGAYTWECDVWSAGMCAFFAATGREIVAVDVRTYKGEKRDVQAMCAREDYHLSGVCAGSGAERVIKRLLCAGARCDDISRDPWFEGCYRVEDPILSCGNSCQPSQPISRNSAECVPPIQIIHNTVPSVLPCYGGLNADMNQYNPSITPCSYNASVPQFYYQNQQPPTFWTVPFAAPLPLQQPQVYYPMAQALISDLRNVYVLPQQI